MTAQLLGLALMLPDDAPLSDLELQCRLAGRLGYFAVHLPAAQAPGEDGLERLIAAAEPAMLVIDDGAPNPGVVRRNDPELVRAARAALDAGEDHRPLIVAVPLSIGRTHNEAVARADRDPRFTGEQHPSASGIFGTFEQAQEQVLALARAGADVLLVTVPQELDIADILAQVRALVVGPTPALFDR